MPRWLRGLLIAAAAVLVVGALLTGGGWYFAQRYLHAPGPSLTATVVDLPRGSGVTAIANQLADAGAIEHPLAFVALARASGRDRSLKAGEYAIEAGMSPEAIMALLESGKVLLHPVAVPEGLTVQEVFADPRRRARSFRGSCRPCRQRAACCRKPTLSRAASHAPPSSSAWAATCRWRWPSSGRRAGPTCRCAPLRKRWSWPRSSRRRHPSPRSIRWSLPYSAIACGRGCRCRPTRR